MARLIKNIDTISHGSLKAGRLLNGLMDNSRIAELIASGHAIATEEDGDLASAGGYDAAKLAFEHDTHLLLMMLWTRVDYANGGVAVYSRLSLRMMAAMRNGC
ncbi:hypothetical protein [Escherichia coli]|uniref:hypothetical protein n=1 Tax=Escherichia coli TaxID=562 RepID=UPI000DFFED1F|nr:hypothetical protein [Escherichia coli]STL59950.1 Uncharacterised protein [Escherichia coli]